MEGCTNEIWFPQAEFVKIFSSSRSLWGHKTATTNQEKERKEEGGQKERKLHLIASNSTNLLLSTFSTDGERGKTWFLILLLLFFPRCCCCCGLLASSRPPRTGGTALKFFFLQQRPRSSRGRRSKLKTFLPGADAACLLHHNHNRARCNFCPVAWSNKCLRRETLLEMWINCVWREKLYRKHNLLLSRNLSEKGTVSNSGCPLSLSNARKNSGRKEKPSFPPHTNTREPFFVLSAQVPTAKKKRWMEEERQRMLMEKNVRRKRRRSCFKKVQNYAWLKTEIRLHVDPISQAEFSTLNTLSPTKLFNHLPLLPLHHGGAKFLGKLFSEVGSFWLNLAAKKRGKKSILRKDISKSQKNFLSLSLPMRERDCRRWWWWSWQQKKPLAFFACFIRTWTRMKRIRRVLWPHEKEENIEKVFFSLSYLWKCHWILNLLLLLLLLTACPLPMLLLSRCRCRGGRCRRWSGTGATCWLEKKEEKKKDNHLHHHPGAMATTTGKRD